MVASISGVGYGKAAEHYSIQNLPLEYMTYCIQVLVGEYPSSASSESYINKAGKYVVQCDDGDESTLSRVQV